MIISVSLGGLRPRLLGGSGTVHAAGRRSSRRSLPGAGGHERCRDHPGRAMRTGPRRGRIQARGAGEPGNMSPRPFYGWRGQARRSRPGHRGRLARPEREVSGMAVQAIAHPGIEERRAAGKQTREQTPPSSHAGWRPAAGRPDPVALLEAQNLTREPDLVPVRHGRMMVSPFTFYRGAATIMAADLKDTPVAGLDAQLCGDAHLSNFGLFASPGTAAAVRPERLRRDAAGAVRVRREADGGEFPDRGPQQRVLQGRRARGDAGVGDGLPGGHGRVRADADDGHLVRPPG